MKIVVTTHGTDLDSAVDPRFGRARYFLLVDTETLQSTAHEHTQSHASQGAGIQAAQAVARLGADAVITGRVGPKAFATLRAAGIAVYVAASGTARQVLEQFQAGRLAKAEGANVGGHWA